MAPIVLPPQPAGPKPTYEQCDRQLCLPGTPFELTEAVIDGRKQKVWKNLPISWRDVIRGGCAKFAERTMLSSPVPEPCDFYAREYVTFAQAYQQALQLAGALREQGVGVEDRVAVGGLNSTGWVVSFMATCLLGAVPVLLNSTLQDDIQLHCLKLTTPKVILADEKLASHLGTIADTLKSNGIGPVWCWSSISHLPPNAQAGVKEAFSIKPSADSVRAVEDGDGMDGIHPDGDGLLAFTSGTTNLPKGVLLSQRGSLQMLISGPLISCRALLRMGMPLKDLFGMMATADQQPQTVMLLAVPLFHVTGLYGAILRQFQNGQKVVFMRRWSVKDAVKLCVDEQVKFIGGVPAIVTAVMQSPLLPKDHVFDALSYGGAPPPKRLVGDIAKRWPTAMAGHAWGMTETNALHVGFGGADYIEKPEAVGRCIPTAEIKIICPDTGKVQPDGELGIIHARGSNLMKRYFNNPEATAEAVDKDGWLDTGDMGFIDPDGDLWIRDRAKDMIIRGGENIASAEVENVVFGDNRVAECAAVPVPDDVLGELVGVAVSLAPGAEATPEDIIAQASTRLRHPARPVIVVILPALPRNANGKIVKADAKRIVGREWERQRAAKAKAKL